MTEEEINQELIKLDRHNLHLKQPVIFESDNWNSIIDMLDLPPEHPLIERVKKID